MAMKVLFPGALSTFQDQGRIGFQKYGITSSGSMDVRSAAMANALVGNDPKEAVLEMTVLGPMLQFSSPAVGSCRWCPHAPYFESETGSHEHFLFHSPR